MSDEARWDDMQQLSTPLQKTIARIWEEVLGIDGITATDDFFELGGHSLLAVQVMARIHEETGGPVLGVRSLIEAPTVAELARVVETG
ncbi:phosphopantetheine-binding protein [Streptomyces sp. NPDC012693]|jgi:phthiocerol/phenolphthiocerol synthesis type-I polyketide synthase E|uniref:phosphopantetheine-binding protein n=1 Tax=unclassified Streptomyces TaxID=2593676 RepID=UPI00202E3AEE|nr:phosphopantetheine-binding protein [Streptomyces sp. MSC1_001]